MGLKLQGLEKEEKKKKKKEEKKKDLRKKEALLQKGKSKPSKEVRKKKGQERSLSPVFEQKRISKTRLLKLVEYFSSSIEAETSAIVAMPMNATTPTRVA